MNTICKEAENLIIEQEVTSAALYRARYTRPTWPQGASGVTIGIGYDCGYSTANQIREDWGSRLPANMVEILASVAGLTGERAHTATRTARVQTVVVPWDAALDEFETVEIPRWLAKVRKVYPNTEKLGPYCEGALVSLAYNRGLALKDKPGSTQRKEMMNIFVHLRDGHPEKIPAEFRSMKRLWNNGLVQRREMEAQLFERGLKSQ